MRALSGPVADTSAEVNRNGGPGHATGKSLIVAHSGTGQLSMVDPGTGAGAAIAGVSVPRLTASCVEPAAVGGAGHQPGEQDPAGAGHLAGPRSATQGRRPPRPLPVADLDRRIQGPDPVLQGVAHRPHHTNAARSRDGAAERSTSATCRGFGHDRQKVAWRPGARRSRSAAARASHQESCASGWRPLLISWKAV
jgi:hypothetical protein